MKMIFVALIFFAGTLTGSIIELEKTRKILDELQKKIQEIKEEMINEMAIGYEKRENRKED